MIRNAKPVLAAILSLAAAAPVVAQPGYVYDWGPPGRAWDLRGPGVRLLYPELREDRRGRAFVARNFDRDGDGWLTRREALTADRAFDAIAGADRARFDWEARHAPPPPPPGYAGGWNREGMRGYHFRQGREGAVFDVSDVLFRTGSAELRPGAEARLRPLAGFLRANPGVRVAIDGNTDSVGAAASNRQLSRDRAASVASALEAMGVDPGRFRLAGRGETAPVASNATVEGRQLNRRVEVTLIGRRAAEFG
ncbi:OmpA family protein [Sphingomonas sp.]|uniref:OmpA family protein n=1 Tax=Sphingomonas sp. TaxID=28214 RepID=UPI003B00A96F